MKKSVHNLSIISNTRVSPDHHLIKLKSLQKIESVDPGQFLNVLIDNSREVFLRRPYSVHAIDYNENTLDILVKGVGAGSKLLTEKQPGDSLNVIFPLGKGFSLPLKEVGYNEKILIVGGGCGVAPLFYLAQTLHSFTDLTILIGAKTVDHLIEIEKYYNFGRVYTATENGTHGEKGYVTQHSLFIHLGGFTKIYTCGPEAMMKAVAAKAKEKGIFCEVSLENTMACGFGVCLCCVTDTIHGHKCTCTDGPVFNINTLKWQI